MKRKYPPGPELKLFPLLMTMTQWMPKRYPLNPLGFAEANARCGDISYYRVGPHVIIESDGAFTAMRVRSPE